LHTDTLLRTRFMRLSSPCPRLACGVCGTVPQELHHTIRTKKCYTAATNGGSRGCIYDSGKCCISYFCLAAVVDGNAVEQFICDASLPAIILQSTERLFCAFCASSCIFCCHCKLSFHCQSRDFAACHLIVCFSGQNALLSFPSV
jgi:hypothetical protein